MATAGDPAVVFNSDPITVEHLKAGAETMAVNKSKINDAEAALFKAKKTAADYVAVYHKLIDDYHSQPPVLEVVT